MKTIVDYLEREQRTFDELAFSPVDSLVLSSVVYFNFDAAGVMDGESFEPVLLHDVVALTPWRDLTASCWMEDAEQTERFVRAVMASRRLRDVSVAFFVNDLVSTIEKQFSVATFLLPGAASAFSEKRDVPASPHAERAASAPASFAEAGEGDILYLAYRGTDGTLAGWKEDFNLTFKDVIPSQAAALQYLSGVASTCTASLMLGGHSKGGNLAEFAALTCDEALYERIVGVFDHDGPSFFTDPSPRMSHPSYLAKLHKTVPSSSVFGLLLEHHLNYHIVQADALPFLSHSPFTWLVEGGDFVYGDELTRGSTAFDQSLDEWLHSVDSERRELFIDTMYELFMSTEASTWSEFQDNLPRNIATMVNEGRKLDSETRGFLLSSFANGIRLVSSGAARAILPEPSKRVRLRRQFYERRGK